SEHNDMWVRFQGASDFYGYRERDNSFVYPKGYKQPEVEGASKDNWFKIYMSQGGRWSWQSRTSDNDAHDVYAVYNSPGVYTVQVSGRSTDFAVDRMVMYQESRYTDDQAENLSRSSTYCDPSTIPAITISRTSPVTLGESGNKTSQNYRFRLTVAPGAPVTFPVKTSSDQCRVTGGPVELTPNNYSNGHVVTVRAIDDNNVDGDQPCNLWTLAPSSNDPAYGAMTASDTPNALITIADDDNFPDFRLLPTASQTLREAGSERVEYTMTTTTAPTAPVTIPLSTSTDQCRIEGAPVVITPSNYNTGVTFTVIARNDVLDDGNQPCNLWTLDPSSNDPVYDALTAGDTPNRLLTIIDNDEEDLAAIRMSPFEPQTLTEAGAQSVTYRVTTSIPPTATVSFVVRTSNNQCTVTSPVEITPSNYATGVFVTVTAVNDTAADGDQACNLWTLDPKSNDARFDALTASDTPNRFLTIIDNDGGSAAPAEVAEPMVIEEVVVEEAVVVEAAVEAAAPALSVEEVGGDAPVVEEAPATEEPAVEEAPAVDEAPVVEEPVVEEVPVVEEPTIEEAPAVEEAPTIEEAPAVEVEGTEEAAE
ncbi:MAG: hypothetical protein AAFV33_10025, partial [Chloroflexota bacterium]